MFISMTFCCCFFIRGKWHRNCSFKRCQCWDLARLSSVSLRFIDLFIGWCLTQSDSDFQLNSTRVQSFKERIHEVIPPAVVEKKCALGYGVSLCNWLGEMKESRHKAKRIPANKMGEAFFCQWDIQITAQNLSCYSMLLMPYGVLLQTLVRDFFPGFNLSCKPRWSPKDLKAIKFCTFLCLDSCLFLVTLVA